eukprot:1033635-Prorocentrum_minimum.AAC.2
MALPKKLLAPSLPLGDDSFEKRVVDLYAASANSQTTYTSVVSQIRELKTTNGEAGTVRVCDNLPIFERMQIRVGAKSLEDIDSYYSLEKILTNTQKTREDRKLGAFMGDYGGDVFDAPVAGLDAGVSGIQAGGMTYIKRLHSGVLNNNDYLFPIHRLNTGNALEVELTLAPKNIALMEVTPGNHANAKFEISNVKFQLTLLKVSDAFFNKYNSLANSNELVLPMTTYKRHISNLAAGATEPVVFVNDNAKNLKRTYTVFRTNPTQMGTVHQPVFLKGANNDAANQLLAYQYRYMSRNFPENKVEARVNDQVMLFMNYLTNTQDDMTHGLPAIASTYSSNLVLAQSFTYSEDEMVNGLNINASGSPLILEMKFNGNGVATNVETFSESTMDLVLDQHGNASIVQKTKMNVE